jgi:RNA polymerase sigma-70 factor, ECF subfamily
MTMIPSRQAHAQLSDDALVARIAGGDKDAFEPLMRRHNRTLFRVARSILKDDAEAEDALQNAYLLAYRTLSDFRADSKLSTWLTRIVINEALARLRKSRRRAEIIHLEAGMDDEQIQAAGDDDATSADEPQAAAMRAQTRRLLERKIDDLPELFRTVFVLREVEEMSVEEVSCALGIPVATVRTRHFRGRSMLREALSREVDFALEDAFNFDGQRCDRIVASVLHQLFPPPAKESCHET